MRITDLIHNRMVLMRTYAARFRSEEDGSLIAFGLILLLLMLGIGGMAVDIIHVETTRTQLQNTLDRSVLAAANLRHNEDPKAIVEDYFLKAGLEKYLDSDNIQVEETTAMGTISFRSVTATASADVDTMFMKLAGIDDITTGGLSAAEEGITDLEISLVVDVSGSMGWGSSSGYSKIYELREAAKDFAYYMQCNPGTDRDSNSACSVTDGKVSISLVPFSEQVTAGHTILEQFNNSAISPVEITNEGAQEVADGDCVDCLGQCVTFSADDFETVDVAAYQFTTPNYQLQRTGNFDARSDKWSSVKSYKRTCRTDNWRQIRPFIEDHNDLYGFINSLSTGGNTSTDIGMKWGSILLNPDMRGIIQNLSNTSDGNGGTIADPAFSNRPYDNGQLYSMKVIVLMSDGVNTTQYHLKDDFRDGPSQVFKWSEDEDNDDYWSVYNPDRSGSNKYYWLDDGNWHDVPYGDDTYTTTEQQKVCKMVWKKKKKKWVEKCKDQNVTVTKNRDGSAIEMTFPELWERKPTRWYKQYSWLGDPDGSYGGSTKDGNLDDICTAAKNAGTIIYTIGFEVSSASDVVLSKCATTPNGHYFKANGSNLADVFGTIASSINQLRLTQ